MFGPINSFDGALVSPELMQFGAPAEETSPQASSSGSSGPLSVLALMASMQGGDTAAPAASETSTDTGTGTGTGTSTGTGTAVTAPPTSGTGSTITIPTYGVTVDPVTGAVSTDVISSGGGGTSSGGTDTSSFLGSLTPLQQWALQNGLTYLAKEAGFGNLPISSLLRLAGDNPSSGYAGLGSWLGANLTDSAIGGIIGGMGGAYLANGTEGAINYGAPAAGGYVGGELAGPIGKIVGTALGQYGAGLFSGSPSAGTDALNTGGNALLGAAAKAALGPLGGLALSALQAFGILPKDWLAGTYDPTTGTALGGLLGNTLTYTDAAGNPYVPGESDPSGGIFARNQSGELLGTINPTTGVFERNVNQAPAPVTDATVTPVTDTAPITGGADTSTEVFGEGTDGATADWLTSGDATAGLPVDQVTASDPWGDLNTITGGDPIFGDSTTLTGDTGTTNILDSSTGTVAPDATTASDLYDWSSFLNSGTDTGFNVGDLGTTVDFTGVDTQPLDLGLMGDFSTNIGDFSVPTIDTSFNFSVPSISYDFGGYTMPSGGFDYSFYWKDGGHVKPKKYEDGGSVMIQKFEDGGEVTESDPSSNSLYNWTSYLTGTGMPTVEVPVNNTTSVDGSWYNDSEGGGFTGTPGTLLPMPDGGYFNTGTGEYTNSQGDVVQVNAQDMTGNLPTWLDSIVRALTTPKSTTSGNGTTANRASSFISRLLPGIDPSLIGGLLGGLQQYAAVSSRRSDPFYQNLSRGQWGVPQARNAFTGKPFASGGLAAYVKGGTAGQADKIPAMLSDGEYIIDADVVSALGDGNNEAGAAALDRMRQNIRRHKRSAPTSKIPPKAKAPEQYMKGAK